MTKQILWTACITPFDSKGKIDYKSLRNCISSQESAGNGMLFFGSTGESLSLTSLERQEMLNFICGLNLKTQIMVGVPSHNLFEAQEWLEFCKDLPIDGYLMTTPIYTKPGINGQTKWFEELLNKAAHPAMLYNIPGRAGIKLHPEAVKNLQHHNNFMGIKDCGGAVDSIVEYKIAAPDIDVYCGDDYMMPSMAIEGAVGLISVASNAWPEATRRYVEFALSRKIMKSKIWWKACHDLFTASNPIPIKALMKDVGMIEVDIVRLPLSLDDLPSRKTLLNYHETMLNWQE